ncbi:GNAT family N-acetyltransferase [Plantibacter flavus]|uniref:GNAT family N-acetyltransferase n=1 Tax=Plantibacter flavus TaxID=150123 RepID=UPI003F17E731
MEADVVIRGAAPEDAAQVAELKLLWSPPVIEPKEWERALFAHDLRQWIAAEPDARVCFVAAVGEQLVGMAWLVVFERAPDYDARRRLTGDVQSVFVRPEFRSRGVAQRLVEAALAAADERGVLRVTVSANADAAPMYLRAGFAEEPTLLERRVGHPDS